MRSGRDDLGGTQTWRSEHKEISAAPKSSARKKSFQADHSREADPSLCWGSPTTQMEETGICTLWDRRGMGSNIQGKILRDNVGKVRRAAGTGRQPAKTPSTRQNRSRGEPAETDE